MISRNVGHIGDLYTGKNLKILTGSPKDVKGIKVALKQIVENKDVAKKMISEGRITATKRGYNTWSKQHLEIYRKI